jgi:hypothetical protein
MIEGKLNFKLLVTVNPEAKDRLVLENYLESLDLIEGKDW